MHTQQAEKTQVVTNHKRRAAFKTNDAGTQFTVAIYLKRLERNRQSYETEQILREIANRLERADFSVLNAELTNIP